MWPDGHAWTNTPRQLVVETVIVNADNEATSIENDAEFWGVALNKVWLRGVTKS